MMTAFLRPRFDTTTSPVRSTNATFDRAENLTLSLNIPTIFMLYIFPCSLKMTNS
jgi:hypothetical protein